MELQIFENCQFGKVRIIDKEGAPWFVAKDVCNILGTETRDIPSILDADEQLPLVDIINTLNDSCYLRKDSRIISGPGLYSLILRSRKPEAKLFKRWITHEVLPSLRKDGMYATDDFIQRSIKKPDWAISVLQQVKFEREKRRRLEKQRDEALHTKAWIGHRREATAMATASSAVRQRDKALDELGEGKTWKQVKASPWLKDLFTLSSAVYSQIGKQLVKLSADLGLEVKSVSSTEHGTIKSYHVDVINRFHAMLLADPAMMDKYRCGF